MRWWEREGGRERYQRELDSLRAFGYDPRPDPDPASGFLRVHITVAVLGEPTKLEVWYPANYPFFRFEVFAPGRIVFKRHQHPSAGTLCLLDQGTLNWKPNSMTAGDVISMQLKKIEDANQSEGPYADEAQTPEPISMYFEYEALSELIIPRELYAIDLGLARGHLDLALSATKPVRGYVEALDGVPTTLPDLSRAFPMRQRVRIPWIRIPNPTKVVAGQLAQELMDSGVLPRPRPLAGLGFDLTALLFEEEIAYRDVMGAGWAFLRRSRFGAGWLAELIRREAYLSESQAARISPISALATKTVFQAGAGGLGAPAAQLLAESRLGLLRLADFDVVSLGIAVRWPLGFAAAGIPKVTALETLIRTHYPETRVEAIANWCIGRPDQLGDEEALVDRVLDGADLVLDATAEPGVQQFLATAARDRGIPCVVVWATPGAFGGVVAVLSAGPKSPCWRCLMYAVEDERIRPPLDARAGTLQLAGCSAATFTGAAFDLIPLSAMAVRVIAQTLASSPAYPPACWNVAVLANRTDDAGAIGETPQWSYLTLSVDPRCPHHDE